MLTILAEWILDDLRSSSMNLHGLTMLLHFLKAPGQCCYIKIRLIITLLLGRYPHYCSSQVCVQMALQQLDVGLGPSASLKQSAYLLAPCCAGGLNS